jgi:hypothetical protein
MTDTVQNPTTAYRARLYVAATPVPLALSHKPPFGGVAAMSSIVPDDKTSFASFDPVVNDVKKGQSGDVYN